MKLNRLEIEYFRCFTKYQIDFAPGITVLIGKNGAGKSTLINAIHKALSFIFKKETRSQDISFSSGIPSLKVEQYKKDLDLVRDMKTGFAYPYVRIKANGCFCQKPLQWEMFASTSTFKMQDSKYTEAFSQFKKLFDRHQVLPVLAFYSDSFPHVESNTANESKTLRELRNFGYYQWNKDRACSSVWIDKYEKAWKEWDRHERKLTILKSTLENHISKGDDTVSKEDVKRKIESTTQMRDNLALEINLIKDCLKNFTANDPMIEIQDLFLDIYEEKLCLETTSGNNPLFYQLPAGYRRLLYMVLEIAYRSFILNGTTESSGIVIIDEIDLHLHPSLEQSILQRLHDTFPNIQFIVSTHSALVIANLDTSICKNNKRVNRVYMLEAGQEHPTLLPNIYGVDYNAAMRDFMTTPDRNNDIKNLMDEFFNFTFLGMETEANSTLDKIKLLAGKDNIAIMKKIDDKLKEITDAIH